MIKISFFCFFCFQNQTYFKITRKRKHSTHCKLKSNPSLPKAIQMPDLKNLANYGFWDYLVNVVMYAVLAVSFFAAFWVIFKDRFKPYRIQQKRITSKITVKREIRNSIFSLIIFTLVDILIYAAQLKGYTKIYNHVDAYGWPYLVLSVVIIMFLHDAWFYWVHRLMHHPLLYKHVHRVHHQSTDPSPFAAFSFHPFEALLEAGVYVVFAFLLPVHMAALWAWQLLQLTLNVIAHLGYEIYPRGFNTHWLLKFKTPSTHHNMHHEKFKGNYGLYFTWWDKLFKTEFEDYNEVYDQIQDRIENSEVKERTEKLSVRPLHTLAEEVYGRSRKAS